jgi:plasmid segregation protein ParM
MSIVAVDVGYGYTKGINENLKNVVFPSLITSGYDRDMETLFNGGIDDLDNLHVKVNGDEYFVGELARRSKLSSITLDNEKTDHNNMLVLLATALGMLGNRNISLVTGLPYEDFKYQKDDLIYALKGKDFDVNYLGGPLSGERKNILIDDVVVFPQAAGALYASSDMMFIQSLAKSGKMVSIVDIGYKTTDVVTFEAGRSFSLRADVTGTVDVGASDIEREY